MYLCDIVHLKLNYFKTVYLIIKYRWHVWRALSALAVCVRFFFSTTLSFNFVFVLETMQLLKYYKTLSMHNKFADIFPFCSCIVTFPTWDSLTVSQELSGAITSGQNIHLSNSMPWKQRLLALIWTCCNTKETWSMYLINVNIDTEERCSQI